jgi:hypothetical protein
MPTSYSIKVEGFPSEAFLRSDDRQRLRNIAGGRTRRFFQKMFDEVKSDTPYPDIAGQYFFEQKTEAATFSFGMGNRSPAFPFIEDDVRAHMPPWGRGTTFAHWAQTHGIPPYLAARSYAQHDHPGKHFLRNVWDRNAAELDKVVEGAVDVFMTRWLQGNLAQD